MLRRKHVVLQNTHKSTRSFRTSDVKARTYNQVASDSPAKAKAKHGYLLNARHDSYQSSHKAREIEKAVTITTSRGTPASNVLPDLIPVKSGQIGRELGAPEREELFFRICFAKNLERTLMPLLCWVGHVDWRGNSNRKGYLPPGSICILAMH